MAGHGVGFLPPFAAPWPGASAPRLSLRRTGDRGTHPATAATRRDRVVPKRSDLRISGRTVDALPRRDRDVVVWDRDVPGFGVRAYASGRKVYLVQCHTPTGDKPDFRVGARFRAFQQKDVSVPHPTSFWHLGMWVKQPLIRQKTYLIFLTLWVLEAGPGDSHG